VDNVDGLADNLGCEVSSLPLSTLVFHWGPVLRTSVFGMVLLKRLSGGWLARSGCICLRVVGLPL
jgi:hypothetical protein